MINDMIGLRLYLRSVILDCDQELLDLGTNYLDVVQSKGTYLNMNYESNDEANMVAGKISLAKELLTQLAEK